MLRWELHCKTWAQAQICVRRPGRNTPCNRSSEVQLSQESMSSQVLDLCTLSVLRRCSISALWRKSWIASDSFMRSSGACVLDGDWSSPSTRGAAIRIDFVSRTVCSTGRGLDLCRGRSFHAERGERDVRVESTMVIRVKESSNCS